MLTWDECIVPDWSAPTNIKAIFTTRAGGVSVSNATSEFASLNIGKSVGDDPIAITENRRRIATLIGHPPRWMGLVHGADVADMDVIPEGQHVVADAAVARKPGVVCVVTMADCLPVLFCDVSGRVVAAAHAGWRGLAAGVLESTIHAMKVPPHALMAYMGQAIGPTAFEVGDDVRDAFVHHTSIKNTNTNIDKAFQPFMAGDARKYWANIFLLARLRLEHVGIPSAQIYGGDFCTFSDSTRFFSYRREGKAGKQSGRMAALIWRE